MSGPLDPEVTEKHLAAADELLRSLSELSLRPLRQKTRRRLAQRLAMLEHHTKTVAQTERTIVGDTDRWIILSQTSPSGKTLFVCRSCGRVTPAPNKTCATPVTLWDGSMRECADWEPSKNPHVG